MRPAPLLPLLCAAMLALPGPVLAQTPGFTPEDDRLMAACQKEVAEPRAAGETARSAHCIGAASDPCMQSAEGGTTLGMSACLARETAWWDTQMNADYEALAETLAPELFTGLQRAQRAWLAFRDADCGFTDTYWAGGTIRALFSGTCRLERTANRAAELSAYRAWGEDR